MFFFVKYANDWVCPLGSSASTKSLARPTHTHTIPILVERIVWGKSSAKHTYTKLVCACVRRKRNKVLTIQGRSYHRGLGGAKAPPPIGLAPPPNIWEIKILSYFYDDSVETPKCKKLFCKISGAKPPNPVLFINKSIIIYLKLRKSNLILPQT